MEAPITADRIQAPHHYQSFYLLHTPGEEGKNLFPESVKSFSLYIWMMFAKIYDWISTESNKIQSVEYRQDSDIGSHFLSFCNM